MTKKRKIVLVAAVTTFLALLLVFARHIALGSIKMYGRVLDQNGQPVEGAQVWHKGTNTYLSKGGGRLLAKTDAQGYFEINTTGAKLALGAVSHADIEYSHQPTIKLLDSRVNDRLNSTKILLSHHDKNNIYDTWLNYIDKDKPYIIKAWRLGKYEGAKKGSILFHTLGDGSTYTLNLDVKQYRHGFRKGTHSDGDFFISCTRPMMKHTRDYGDWSFSITPNNGGIQTTNDEFLNRAPLSGYKSSFTVSMELGRKDYTHRMLRQRYYITLNRGGKSIYGSLFMHTRPFIQFEGNKCKFDIVFKINYTSSQNLELKKVQY